MAWQFKSVTGLIPILTGILGSGRLMLFLSFSHWPLKWIRLMGKSVLGKAKMRKQGLHYKDKILFLGFGFRE